MCYICGREFGTMSLQIHIKTCEKKWEVAQEQLPLKERRKCPEPPQNFEGTMAQVKSGKMQMRSKQDIMLMMNEEAYNKWDTEALVACRNCNRTFLPDRLKIHERSCKVGAKKKIFTVDPVTGGLKQLNLRQK